MKLKNMASICHMKRPNKLENAKDPGNHEPQRHLSNTQFFMSFKLTLKKSYI